MDNNVINDPNPISMNKKSPNKMLIAFVVLILILVVALIVAVIQNHNKSNNKSSSTPQVSITKSGFLPNTIAIKAGQTVTWINQSNSPHQVASDPYPTDNDLANFKENGSLAPGGKYSFKFVHKGTYLYHDEQNPYKFKGTVIVK